jgi:ribbon-helix-helix CopG family protein
MNNVPSARAAKYATVAARSRRTMIGPCGIDCGADCGILSTVMKTIQIVLEEKLLRAADRAAHTAKMNRSALFREALREYLKRKRLREMEERERQAYKKHPLVEFEGWDEVAAWPED